MSQTVSVAHISNWFQHSRAILGTRTFLTSAMFNSILVIGGSGFIGRHLVAKLSQSGRKVIVPTRHYEHARPLLVLPGVDVIEANVHDQANLERLMQNVDAVVNLV